MEYEYTTDEHGRLVSVREVPSFENLPEEVQAQILAANNIHG